MKNWSDSLATLQRSGQPHVLVTVIGTAGSTPRGAGSKMLVTADDAIDSIGGGQLEFKAIQHARELLLSSEPQQQLQHFPLGASVAQCCGGQATLLFESYPAREAELLLFGAGHVAKALVTILQELPLHTQWIDHRPGFLPEQRELSANIQAKPLDEPLDALNDATAGSLVLIMTHDHQLDYALAEAALKMEHFAYVGVIGSKTKAARFRHRLQLRELTEAQLAGFHCPVGLAEVGGKKPMEVAVSVAGQLIALYQAGQARSPVAGVPLKTMKELISTSKSVDKAKTE